MSGQQNPNEYPEFLLAVAEFGTEFFLKQGMSEQEAAKAGVELADDLRMKLGGATVYIPKALSFDLTKRDAEILETFNGSNFREVCDRFGISQRRIYQILHATRKGKQEFFSFDPEEGE